MWNLFLDLFFPRRSLTGTEGRWITEAERRTLRARPVIEEEAALRQRGIRHLDRLVAASTYTDCPLLRSAIRTFKYGKIPDLQTDLARLMLQAPAVTKDTRPVLCPVPLHWARRFARGFNQAESLARVLSHVSGLAMAPLLRRVRWTGSQVLRGRDERLTAMENAFRCIDPSPPPFVLLIDDLSTTGATLDQCAKALKDAGVKRVEGWVIAHDVFMRDKPTVFLS